MQIWNERGGATRIEVPPVVQLVDPVRGELIIALPDGSVLRQDLPTGASALGTREELAWLDELRAFQGIAEPVPTPRSIGAIEAEGWRLELSGMQHTLWVDPQDQRPLMLDAKLGGGVSMETTFTFDAVLEPDLFRIPDFD